MLRLNRFQRWMLQIAGINPNSIVAKAFDVNKALWDRYRDGKKEGYAQGRSEKVDCQSCSLYQQATKGVQIYLDPRVRQAPYEQGVRQRAITRQLYPNTGDRTRHEEEVQRKKAASQDPKTAILPTTPQPHKLRFHRIYAEPNSPFTGL